MTSYVVVKTMQIVHIVTKKTHPVLMLRYFYWAFPWELMQILWIRNLAEVLCSLGANSSFLEALGTPEGIKMNAGFAAWVSRGPIRFRDVTQYNVHVSTNTWRCRQQRTDVWATTSRVLVYSGIKMQAQSVNNRVDLKAGSDFPRFISRMHHR